MSTDTSLLQKGLAVSTSQSTPVAASGITASGSTVASQTTTAAVGQGSTAKLGLFSTYPYSYGTSIAAGLGIAASAFFVGAAFVGVGLLSYAVTKAALEP